MRLTLINPPESYDYNHGIMELLLLNQGYFPPINLVYLASYLNAKGHRCQIVDANPKKIHEDEISKRILDFRSDLIGFSIHALTFNSNIDYFKKISKKVNLPTLVGGYGLDIYAKEIMEKNVFDFLIRGNAIDALSLIDSIEKNEELDSVNGLVYNKNGNIIFNDFKKNAAQKVEISKYIDWSLVDLNNYYTVISKKRYAITFTSFGCPFKCIFCSEGSSQVYNRPLNEIIKELDQLDRLQAKYVEFLDSTFTLNKNRAITICKEISKKNYSFKIGLETRADLIDDELIYWFKKANVERINMGVEVGSDKLQRILKKNINLFRAKKTIAKLNDYGFTTVGNFILGNPHETRNTINKTITFAKDTRLTFAFFSKLVPYHGTELYEMYKCIYGDFWKDYMRSNGLKSFKILESNLNNSTIDGYIKKAYSEFYLRPIQILRILRRINSFRILTRYLKIGFLFIVSKFYKNNIFSINLYI